jgi:hypothetical protein
MYDGCSPGYAVPYPAYPLGPPLAASEEVRRELAALNPDDTQIVVHARGAWRVKGIIQVRTRSVSRLI